MTRGIRARPATVPCLDHVVIGTRDLPRGKQTLVKAGFTPATGGEHEGRGTANELVRLQEGYLELLTVVDRDQAMAAGGSRRQVVDFLDAQPIGLLGYALEVHDLDHWLESLKQDDVSVTGPHLMSRTQPDGRRLSWRTGLIHDRQWLTPYPFLIEWAEPSEDRWAGAPADHANCSVAISRVEVSSRDIREDVRVYQALGAYVDSHDRQSTMLTLGPLSVELTATEASCGHLSHAVCSSFPGTRNSAHAKALHEGELGLWLSLDASRKMRG
ncbi:VOC family protein [Ornithinimicrobium kibberense]|uniref:VOC family protein n=1 Tax=Ornithinimicrobium kibberense TaxID=282060 RepID=A0ABV5V5U6_9MICO|nr:VOC family protein [Ornithinimicrobium kibberense]